MKQMYVYVQYCWSGDYILEVMDLVIKCVMEQEVDDYIVVVLSDVNLEWYGIFVEVFGKVFMLDGCVNVFVIFIGIFGNQVDR